MKNLIFGLLDVLIKGEQNIDLDISYLEALKIFCSKNNINMYLVTGYKEKDIFETLKKYKLFNYFKSENIIYIDDKYLSTLSDLDLKLREEKRLHNPNYCDEYHKIYFIKSKEQLNSNQTLYVGHDIWTDAYYVTKYTSANIILVKKTLSYNNKPYDGDLKTMYTFNSDFEELKTFLENKKTFDYTPLHNFAKNILYSKMIDNFDLSKIDFTKIFKNEKLEKK